MCKPHLNSLPNCPTQIQLKSQLPPKSQLNVQPTSNSRLNPHPNTFQVTSRLSNLYPNHILPVSQLTSTHIPVGWVRVPVTAHGGCGWLEGQQESPTIHHPCPAAQATPSRVTPSQSSHRPQQVSRAWGLHYGLGGRGLSCSPHTDPFGGDPFRESDPFRGSIPDDFGKKQARGDPFTSDPFSKNALPAQVSTAWWPAEGWTLLTHPCSISLPHLCLTPHPYTHHVFWAPTP